MSLDLCCNIQMVGLELFGVKNMMDPSCLVSMVEAGGGGGGVMVWGMFSWHT